MWFCLRLQQLTSHNGPICAPGPIFWRWKEISFNFLKKKGQRFIFIKHRKPGSKNVCLFTHNWVQWNKHSHFWRSYQKLNNKIGDQRLISPYNMNTLTNRQGIRIYVSLNSLVIYSSQSWSWLLETLYWKLNKWNFVFTRDWPKKYRHKTLGFFALIWAHRPKKVHVHCYKSRQEICTTCSNCNSIMFVIATFLIWSRYLENWMHGRNSLLFTGLKQVKSTILKEALLLAL